MTCMLSPGGNLTNRPIQINSFPPVCVNNKIQFQPRGIPTFEFEPARG